MVRQAHAKQRAWLLIAMCGRPWECTRPSLAAREAQQPTRAARSMTEHHLTLSPGGAHGGLTLSWHARPMGADSGCAKRCHLRRMRHDRCLGKRRQHTAETLVHTRRPRAKTGDAIGYKVPSLGAALGMLATYSALKKWSTHQGRTARHPQQVRSIIGTLHCGDCYEP